MTSHPLRKATVEEAGVDYLIFSTPEEHWTAPHGGYLFDAENHAVARCIGEPEKLSSEGGLGRYRYPVTFDISPEIKRGAKPKPGDTVYFR